MYTIESTEYGFRLTIEGLLDLDDLEKLRCDMLEALAMYNRPFALLVDVQKAIPFEPEVARAVAKLHAACHEMSMTRAAIVVKSPVARGQAAQISFDAGSCMGDMVFDAGREPDWESKAMDWVTGVAPLQTGPIPRVR